MSLRGFISPVLTRQWELFESFKRVCLASPDAFCWGSAILGAAATSFAIIGNSQDPCAPSVYEYPVVF
jgi:hypothetical protein